MTKTTQLPYIPSPGIGTSFVVVDDSTTARLHYSDLVSSVRSASVGYTGSQGDSTGIQGTIGPQGIQGYNGAQGTNGRMGLQGVQGISGAYAGKGDTGLQGVQGRQGIQGIAGTTNVSNVTTDVMPAVTQQYNIGSPSKYWKNFYANTVTTTAVKNSSGISLFSEKEISVRDYGAVGDGTTDDTTAINAALAAASAAGGGRVTIPSSFRCLVDSANINIPTRVALVGTNKMPIINSLHPTSVDATIDTCKSAIILNPAFTIKLFSDASTDGGSHSSSISGLYILKKGILSPKELADTGGADHALSQLNAFSGTAITIGSGANTMDGGASTSNGYVGHCHISGFTKAIYATYSSRLIIEYVSGDSTNGIHINNGYDSCQVSNCFFWPFLTYGFNTYADLMWRNGAYAAYYFDGVQTSTIIENCFSFAFSLGFYIGPDALFVRMHKCTAGAYNLSISDTGRTGTKGFYIRGPDTQLTSCDSSAFQNNYYIDAGIRPVKLYHCTSISQKTEYHVYVLSGWLQMLGGSLFGQTVTTKMITLIAGYVIGFSIDQVVFDGVAGNTVELLAVDVPGALLAYGTIGYNNVYLNGVTNSASGILGTTKVKGYGIDSIDHIFAFGGPSKYGHLTNHWFARGSNSSPETVKGNDVFAWQGHYGYVGSAYLAAGGIRHQVDYTDNTPVPAGTMPSKFVVSTRTSAVGTDASTCLDRFVVGADGHLVPASDNAYSLGNSTTKWSVVYASNGTIQTSDRRLKTEIATATLGLDFINDLRPVSYKWISGGKKVIRQVYLNANGNEIPEGQNIPNGSTSGRIITEDVPGNRTHWGLIAQEVKEVLDKNGVDFGGWVQSDITDPNSTQHINYAEFISPLIKAIQELSAEVAALKSKLQ